MVYQVFARKWRPKSFASLKGQEHITRALVNALDSGKLHHAYLFTGTRGVGKTTLARLLAKCLNCEQGVTADPCGHCFACVEIDAGRFVDLIEVDAASRTRVEDTRELLDNVQYASAQGRFKIYLIDEVHMLSGHSFNALLKTLEEPPPHVKFILATTDPERVPVTVLSRCLRFNLRALSVSDIVAKLAEILSAENIVYETNALSIIAKAASGSMRDALSLLEQGVAYCAGDLKAHAVEEVLGMSYQRFFPAFFTSLLAMDIKNCLEIVAEMALNGADFEQVLAATLQALHAIAIAQAVPDQSLASFAEIDPSLLALKDKLLPEEAQLLYQIALMGQRDLRLAPEPRIGFEMVLLRMIVFRPTKEESIAPKLTKPAASVAPPLATPVKEIVEKEDLPLEWAIVTSKLSLSGLSRVLVQHCVVTKWHENQLFLTLDSSQKACLNPQRQTQIQEALSQHFGRPIKLFITVGEINGATPMMQAQTLQNEREKLAKETIEQDKTVQGILSTFDATIEKITTK